MTRRGIHVPGVSGSLPRNLERDQRITEMRRLGLRWTEIAGAVDLDRGAVRKAWVRHQPRLERLQEMRGSRA